MPAMKNFDSLTEREALALAISREEEDARIYEDFADGLQENYPQPADKFRAMRQDEDSHRHRLLELFKARFGDHGPLIQRQDVRGFVTRRSVWLVRPLGLKAVQRAAESMELETRRFHETAARRSQDAGKDKGGQALARTGVFGSGKNRRNVTDGPFAESKEVVGGYFLRRVADLDKAIAIAQQCPGLPYGAKIEVRSVAGECPTATETRVDRQSALASASQITQTDTTLERSPPRD